MIAPTIKHNFVKDFAHYRWFFLEPIIFDFSISVHIFTSTLRLLLLKCRLSFSSSHHLKFALSFGSCESDLYHYSLFVDKVVIFAK